MRNGFRSLVWAGWWVVSLGIVSVATADAVVERRIAYRDELLRLLPKSPAWEQWLQRTGELPPDFAALPGQADLPDPLRFTDGRLVKNRAAWRQRREELLGLFQDYVIGRVPPPPGKVTIASEKMRREGETTVTELTLAFGPDSRARLGLEVIAPAGPGPFPVFITQENHRRWALIAVSRGYLACVYNGADSRDDTGAWVDVWPEYDWTKLTRRAWAASRCVDYLLTRSDVNPRQIALTGHSRNGKTSLIAAALDERISAVISSSSGAGGACTWRLFSETQFGEGIELITRVFPDWLHPRLRFFTGREDKLPIDQHELIACVAPRHCLISTALNDNVESVWAVERTLSAVRPVFRFLGAADRVALRYREGPHATRAQDIEVFVDWLDERFGRARQRTGQSSVESQPVFPTWEDWLRAGGRSIRADRFPLRVMADLLRPPGGGAQVTAAEWEAKRSDIRQRAEWLLGEAPPMAVSEAGPYGAEGRHLAVMLNRDQRPSLLAKESLNFGNYLAGDLYYPTNVVGTSRRLPALLWLHPISVSNGYLAGYHRGEAPHLTMARTGYAVFAFDQIGNGSRVAEVRDFYRRYPHWSLLGRTVADARAAVDVLRSHPLVDSEQVYVVGYGTGSLAALLATALDDRVAGVIAIAGLTPFRRDTADSGTGGIARWSRWLPLLPRLGHFIGDEARIPCDLEELLALVAPRPALVVTPRIDYQSSFPDLRAAVDTARGVYGLLGAPDALVFQRADDYHHFTPDLIWCLCGAETIR
jgi:dienelactone hydrolase